MRITKVYTKNGDDGFTGLAGGERVSKTHPRVETYGTVDELNSALGLARGHLERDPIPLPEDKRNRALGDLAYLQNLLFTLGGDLSMPRETRPEGVPVITPAHTTDLEARIDSLNGEIPPLEDFILPAGSPAVAALHLARTICRRAERCAVALAAEEDIGGAIVPFLNRLSDYLFVLARWVAISSGEEETTWEH